jgi:sugar transferase (PEP-CTERM system associated)
LLQFNNMGCDPIHAVDAVDSLDSSGDLRPKAIIPVEEPVTLRILKHYWQLPLALLAVIEIALFLLAPYLAVWLRFDGDISGAESTIGPIWPRALFFAALTFMAMVAMGLHNSRQRSRLLGMVTRLGAGILGGALATTVAFYIFPPLHMGRGTLALTILIAFLSSAIIRLFFHKVMDEDMFKRRVLVYGAGRMAGSIARLRRRSDRRGFMVIAYVPTHADDSSDVAEEKKMRPEASLLALCRDQRIDEIVVAMDDRRLRLPMNELLECRLEGIEIVDLVSFLERETGKVRLDLLNPSWMIFSDGFRQGPAKAALERSFDLAASLTLMIPIVPVILLIAIAVKLEEGFKARIFYRQVRVGHFGRPFNLLKFRSMREDAEIDGKARWAEKNDTRITGVGAFIRKTRIDELPQIINVVRGEMSFVGPRPERPEFVSHLNDRIPYYRERHSVKPGITGWAQLCYPYGASEQDAAEKLQYDLYYVKNHSMLFYLTILLQTIEVIVWGKGAR